MEVTMVLAVLKSRIWADTVKFTNVIVAWFRKCKYLVGEGKVFVKNKAKVVSSVGCSDTRVLYFRKLLFKSDKKKLSFRWVDSKSSRKKSVVQHFASVWYYSGILMDGRKGRVVCHLHTSGNLRTEMKREYWVGLYTWQGVEGQELSHGVHYSVYRGEISLYACDVCCYFIS